MARKRPPESEPTGPLLAQNRKLTKFSCLGHVIRVHHDAVPQVGDGDENDDYGLMGTTRPADLEIVIHPTLTGTVRQGTELHEALHIMDTLGGLGLKHRHIYALENLIQQFLATAIYEEVDE